MEHVRGLLERVSSPYNELVARRVFERVDLDVEGATFATWHPRFLLTGYSWDAISAACLLGSSGPPRSVLLLGLGGGTVARQLRALAPAARLVGVEIDEAILELARRYMALDEIGVEVVVGDAYRYLEGCRERFDVVIDDLFLTGRDDVTRSAVPEGEVLGRMTELLEPGGTVVANLIVDRGHHRVRRRARAAFLSRFPVVRAVRPPLGLNEVLVGGERVAGRRALDEYRDVFPEPHDQKLWDGIEVVGLRRRPGEGAGAFPAPGDSR